MNTERTKNIAFIDGQNLYIGTARLEKILFPNRKFASSLYKKLGSEYFDTLENVKNKIGVQKKRAP